MENDFMNITQKIEQRQSEVKEALRQETKLIEEALSKLKESLTEQIELEVSSLANDLKRQEKTHYEANKLRLQAIEEALGIKVTIKKNKEGKLVSDIKRMETEGMIEKIKNKIGV